MSDHDLRDDLDRRAATAAADLRARAAARRIPAWDADAAAVLVPAPTPLAERPRPRRWLAAAAVVAVIAAGAAAALVATRPAGDDPPAAPVATGDAIAYETATPPEGLALSAAIEGEVLDDPLTTGVAIYGPEPEAPAVGLARVAGWSVDDLATDPAARPLDVDGAPAIDLTNTGFGLARHVAAVDDPSNAGAALVAMSPTIPAEQLVAHLRATTIVDGAPRLAADAVPQDWDLLTVAESGIYGGSPVTTARRGTPARALAYGGTLDRHGAGTEPTPALEVVAEPAAEDWAIATRLVAAQVEAAEVGGRAALLVTNLPQGDEAARSLSFEAAPGQLVQVTGWDVPLEAVEAAAAAVAPVSSQRWDELVEQGDLGLLDAERVVLAQGTTDGPDGVPWVLSTSDEISLQLQVALGRVSDGSGSSTTDDDPNARIRAMTATVAGDQRFLALLVRPEVASVVLVHGDEQTELPTEPIDVDAEVAESMGAAADSRLVVVELRPDDAEVQLLDADGDVLATHVVREDGLPNPEPEPGG